MNKGQGVFQGTTVYWGEHCVGSREPWALGPGPVLPVACCVSLDESLPFSGSFLIHKQKILTRELKVFLALLFYD